jgi:hypothetical protein
LENNDPNNLPVPPVAHLKKVVLTHLAIGALGTFIVWGGWDLLPAMSFMVGVFVSLLSLVSTAYFVRLFLQKSVAQSVGVIVVKYALLFGIIFVCFKRFGLMPMWFALGITVFVATVAVSPMHITGGKPPEPK